MKVGRNQRCPCGSARKFKRCCDGRVDWEAILVDSRAERVIPNLSVRGKNLLFLDKLAGALQLDRLDPTSVTDFKRAFTPKAVREIYEAVILVWTGLDDLVQGLRSEQEQTSALYVGMYEIGRVLRGVTRHALYSERILLIDPLTHPFKVRDEYNPILNPEQYAQDALRWAWLWLLLAPWIEADLIHFVRSAEDFDTRLFFAAAEVTERRYKEHPELRETARSFLDEEPELAQQFGRQQLLRAPDWYLRQAIAEVHPEATPEEHEQILEAFHRERDRHPLVLDPPEKGSFSDITVMSSGALYEMAKWTASVSGSHLVTDLPSRWKEIEIDYDTSGIEERHWSPFAKALQSGELRSLNSVPLDAALDLRGAGALGSMRDFFARVWHQVRGEEPFAEENAVALAAELKHEMASAKEEWDKIDRELVRWSTAELAAGLVAAGPAIASGSGAFLAGGMAVAGLGNLIWAHLERRGFTKRHPAAFLLNLST